MAFFLAALAAGIVVYPATRWLTGPRHREAVEQERRRLQLQNWDHDD